MKLLLCLNRLSDHKALFDQMGKQSGQQLSPQPDPQSANFIFSTNYLGHEIDVCETGFGIFQTSYKITKTLTQKKYHLALKASFCNTYKAELNIGDIVNVIKDKPGDIGMNSADGFRDLYDLKLSDPQSFPHFKEAFINMNNSYMNVMMPFKKVVSVTVNQYADVATYEAKREKYKADIETGDGLGFVYACMYERQPFYQLNCVERNLATGLYDYEKAKTSLNDTLLDILQKL
ncbi:MAG: mqnB [Bacteroidetes bacterium]|nr:mqnB [Bacteroidota bacterium]